MKLGKLKEILAQMLHVKSESDPIFEGRGRAEAPTRKLVKYFVV